MWGSSRASRARRGREDDARRRTRGRTHRAGVRQGARARALRNEVTMRSCLDLSARLRSDGAPPIILFTYYNPIHRMGLESFAAAAAASGVDGVLVTDLPPEEAVDLKTALRPKGVDLIFLLS